MTKILHQSWRVMLLCAALATSLTASADKLWSDSFDYQVGDLYGQGAWWRLAAANTDEPVQVVDDALTFEGYQSTAAGKAVKLSGTALKSERVKREFSDTPMTEGTLYYAMLVKPTEFPQTNSTKFVIAGLAAKNFNGWGDGIGNTSIYNTVSISKGSEEGKFQFGFASAQSVPEPIDGDLDLGKTYLVVVGYDFATKDISFWLNPADADAKPTKVLEGKGSFNATNGLQGVCLYQQGSSNAEGTIIVDHVRVATDMASLFKEEKPQTKGKLLLSDSFQYGKGDLYNQGAW